MFPSGREMRGVVLLAAGVILIALAVLLALAFFLGRWTA